MRYLGIDPGTRCGWALLDSKGRCVGSGVWDLGARRHEGGGMRFLRLERYITETVGTLPAVVVAYEEVRRHLSVDSAHVYGGIIATVSRFCEELSIPYRGIPVGTIKKLATGKGNADKNAMVAAAELAWGIKVVDDNHADALWIAEALRQELTMTIGATA